MESDFEQQGLCFRVLGLDAHQPFAGHAQSARRKGLCTVQRLTIVTSPELEPQVRGEMVRLGASGYTSIPCYGAGRQQLQMGLEEPAPQVRIEVIAPKDSATLMMDLLRRDLQPQHRLTFCMETVQVERLDAFTPDPACMQPHAPPESKLFEAVAG